ncbi:MAG: RidA family protein [Nitrospinae bacterium]|nr:RidA family protein [Nitrospinota bacterium]
MKRQNIQPEALATRVVRGHVLYSHVVVAEGRRMVFISGQLARDRHGNVVGKGDMRAQIRQVGENIKTALEAAGATLSDLVRTTTYVVDIEAFFQHVDVRMEYFVALPTSTTVEVRRLAHPDFLVEIEAIAVVE